MSHDGTTDASLTTLLAYIKEARGFDFSGYKRTSLERRIRKRMEEVDVATYPEYHDRLEVDQDEFAQLFDTILINVTGFFRDAPAWEFIAEEVVPALLERLGEDDPIRVWCAACASGEETYTMAMVLARTLGDEAYLRRVKIYATEVDEDALNQARQGSYTLKQVEPVPPELRDRYFDRVDKHYVFRKDLRRSIIFGRNDLTQDAPISRIDLLTCRNALMYFNAETQERIVNRLHFALNPRGYLFLGKSEMLITHSDLFRPVNLRRRVFSRVAGSSRRERVLPRSLRPEAATADASGDLRDHAFEAGLDPELVVDAAGVLVAANAQARALFGVDGGAVGRPLRDLELSYRPVELRASLDIVFAEGRATAVSGARFVNAGAEPRLFDVEIAPLRAEDVVAGASIVFRDVTGARRAEEELETARRELSTAYEELQSTVEELETTNEELQSTNEELETTNEELQSANEELETMNEELQSTNEELETMNDEMRVRSVELNEVNDFLERILGTMQMSVIVLDGDQRVQIWNGESTEMWGVRADEAQGQNLWSLDIGLPMDGVNSAVANVLSGREERADLDIDATNRRGHAVRLHVTCLALGRSDGAVGGALLLAEAAPKA
jgi:two-component system, chemotaxis family, CheB/CheR fusion protein